MQDDEELDFNLPQTQADDASDGAGGQGHGSSDAPPTGHPRFTTLSLLGQGGMGAVFLVEDRDLERRIALKIDRAGSPVSQARFLREAKVMAQLDHPNILPVHDLGRAKGNRPYYTMPVVQGQSLRDVLDALRRKDANTERGYSLTRRVQVFLQVAQAVAFAHSRGILHCDLKPSNVMLGQHGEVRVLDWGASRDVSDVAYGVAGAIGTRGYMSPEQNAGCKLDGRSEVYSLGILLYELLTLTLPSVILKYAFGDELQTPRAMVLGKTIPLELEHACLRALKQEPEARHQSVRELHDDVQRWLESDADREKRRERAEERAREGLERLEEYRRLRDEGRRAELDLVEVRGRFKGWQPASEKSELFAAEDRLEGLREELVTRAGEAVAKLQESLGFDPTYATAREALADYYWDRMREAEGEQDRRDRDFNRKLVEQYHDGKYVIQLRGDGSMELDSEPSAAEVWIYSLVERGLVLREEGERFLGFTPLVERPLPMGSYLVILKKEGFRDVRYPVHITRNRIWKGTVKLYTETSLGTGAVYVASGPFVRGGDANVSSTGVAFEIPRCEESLESFCIAVHPVTASEYLEFLNQLAREDPVDAWRRAPRRVADGGQYLDRLEDGTLALPSVDAEGDTWDPRHPAVGMSWHDAVAYCDWRSRREGREYRLPTESEWEKSARGVDGRLFPWGNRFDDSLCNTRFSRRQPGMVCVGEFFPSDVSIYGACSMAGNVREWTATGVFVGEGCETRLERVMRGSSYGLGRVFARCAARSLYNPDAVNGALGFRWVRSVS